VGWVAACVGFASAGYFTPAQVNSVGNDVCEALSDIHFPAQLNTGGGPWPAVVRSAPLETAIEPFLG